MALGIEQSSPSSKFNFKNSLAIVIAINAYKNSSIPQLKTPVFDGQKLSNILNIEYGYEVWQLLDKTATLANISELLENFLPKKISSDDDRVLFYYAGHGMALNDLDLDMEDMEEPKGYLIPQDAEMGNTSTYLSMAQLFDSLNNLPCRHFLGIFDCAFAGSLRYYSSRGRIVTKSLNQQLKGEVEIESLDIKRLFPPKNFCVDLNNEAQNFIKAPAWQIITSCSFDQFASDINPENKNSKHSPFAEALFEGLQGKADLTQDGIITSAELVIHLRNYFQSLSSSNYRQQTPELWPLPKHGRGEYIFTLPEKYRKLSPVILKPKVVKQGRYCIVTIGINAYKEWQHLRNAVKDAESIQELLVDKFGFIAPLDPLINQQATKKAIETLVEERLRHELYADDSLLLFFAGHGHTRLDKLDEKTEIETGFLIPVEAQIPKTSEYWSDYIRIDHWLNSVSTLKAKHILVILDSCYSGCALSQGIKIYRDSNVRYQEDLTSRRSRKVITSARANQYAQDGGFITGNSLFTGTIINGLKLGEADLDANGIITSSELALFVQQKVAQASKSLQTPDFGSFELDDRGEMVISCSN